MKSFRTYYQCQLSLLLEEIRQKKSIIRVLLTEFEFLHSTLQAEISFIGFPLVRSIFLGNNDKVLKKKTTIQKKEFNNLLKDKKLQHNPDKTVF